MNVESKIEHKSDLPVELRLKFQIMNTKKKKIKVKFILFFSTEFQFRSVECWLVLAQLNSISVQYNSMIPNEKQTNHRWTKTILVYYFFLRQLVLLLLLFAINVMLALLFCIETNVPKIYDRQIHYYVVGMLC